MTSKNHKVNDFLGCLELGDFIQVDWLDASEATGTLNEHRRPEMPVSEFGVFLGSTGSPRHVVVGKFYVHKDRAWHAARILESLVVSGKILVKRAVPDAWLRRYAIKSYAKKEFVVRRNGVQA